MSTVSAFRLATVAAVAPLAFIVGAGVAYADPPSPSGSCSVWHATTQDGNGKTMWCNHTMTGTHDLVWQYGGPSEISGPSPRPQGTDAQGFLGYPAARCNYVNPAVIMGRTLSRSW
jgi:hypothetical protein